MAGQRRRQAVKGDQLAIIITILTLVIVMITFAMG